MSSGKRRPRPAPDGEPLMSSGMVGAEFRVSPNAVARWVRLGLIQADSATPGGHLRFRESTIRALLDGEHGRLAG